MIDEIKSQKSTLFALLESFFQKNEETWGISDLHDAYVFAKKSGSHESYVSLLGKLSQTTVKPGFIVECVPVGNSCRYKIIFLDDDINNENSFLTESTDNDSFQLTKENVFGDFDETSFTRNTESIGRINTNLSKHGKKISNLDAAVEIIREDVQRLKHSMWYDPQYKSNDNENEEMECPADAFSFIMIEPCSTLALSAVVIFFIQIASFFLAIQKNFIITVKDDEFAKSPPFDLPVGVGPSVHASQGITVFLIVLVQESLWEAVADLSNGYNDHLKDQNIKFIWWLLPSILRITGSFVALFVTFILVLVSANTVDLFKDFTAMLFVSSFDNILFALAKTNILGKHFKSLADRVERVTYKFTHLINQKRIKAKSNRKFKSILKKLTKPYMIAAILYAVLYYEWITLLLLPHFNGDYLCQEMFIQLDNSVNPKLSFFSGRYSLVRGSDKRGIYPAYKEEKLSLKNSDSNEPMILRYCESLGLWVFSVQQKKYDHECDEETFLIKSSIAEDEQQFNVFEISQDEWTVRFDNTRFIPKEDLLMICLDQEDFDLDYVINNQLCKDLEVDERFDFFESSRKWSHKFSALKDGLDQSKFITTYEHLVYMSSEKNEQDILFFTGNQWVITSLQDLYDFEAQGSDDLRQRLGLYMKNHFHGNSSNYKVTFISEPVVTDTPEDTMTPISLNWYLATVQVENEPQVRDLKKRITTSLLCSNCNKTSNPCYFGGRCLEDRSCECTSGSSGTLCQLPPTENGKCDDTFNNFEFSYDGGDCCINTCQSGNYICGRDATKNFYVGFELCKVNNCVDCWQNSKVPMNLAALSITFVDLSENGRILALIDAVSNSVRVYDKDGSMWTLRGSPVTRSDFPNSDSVKVSGIYESMNYGNIMSQASVAFKSGRDVRIYDWIQNQWEEEGTLISKNWTETIKEIELYNSGKTLGVIGVEGSFSLFHRTDYTTKWIEVRNLSNEEYSFFSLSMDGDKFVLATAKTVEVHNKSHIISSKSFPHEEVKNIKLSPGGGVLAVLLLYEGKNGEIVRYNVTSQSTFDEMGNTLRGISTVDSKLEISDNGMTFESFSGDTNELNFYRLKGGAWEPYHRLTGISMSMSSDGTAITMLSYHESTAPGSIASIDIYNRNDHCPKGSLPSFFTFIPDNLPEELTWELFVVTSSGIVSSLQNGGPYQMAGSMIVEKLCVNETVVVYSEDHESDSCLGIKILDRGLDGMTNPGKAGFSVNGTIKWSKNITHGYKSIYPIHGNKTYLDQLIDHNPWTKTYEPSVHTTCLSASCTWNQIGSVAYEYDVQNKLRFMQISADGSVFALGNRETETIRVFKFELSRGWIQRGLNITGIQTGSYFGHSVCLSADGSIIAVGVPYYDSYDGKNNAGQVRVYHYSHYENDWTMLGSALNGDVEDLRFGWSLSLSSDGKTIAVGISKYSEYKCHAFVFNYNIEANEWIRKGDCLPGRPIPLRTNVRLSGTASVIAIASFNYMYARVFRYNETENLWHQKGSNIETSFKNFGWQMSLSSDGSILASACYARDPLQVFQFDNQLDDWVLKGQPITTTRGYFYDLSLSSNGSILVVTYDNVIRLFIYDKMAALWVETLVKVPEINYSDRYPRLATSADCLVIAAKEDRSIAFYRLFVENSKCKVNENFFNFTISPDKFPEDVKWSLKGENGDFLIGGRLPPTAGGTQISYVLCVSERNSRVSTFFIEDTYGDGVCCAWGNGSFQVEWNDKIVARRNIGNFETKELICIPNASVASLYSFDMELNPGKPISWNLFDSTYDEVLMDGFVTATPGSNNTFLQCLPSFDCINFALFDPTASGNSITILKNQEVLYEHKNDTFYLKRVSLGNCTTRQCPNGYSLFELDIGTDMHPYQLHWQLLDSTYNILASPKFGSFKEREKYYYFHECIPSNECVTFKMFNGIIFEEHTDRNSSYIVTLDGSIVQEDRKMDHFLTSIKMGNCNIPSCLEEEIRFELDVYTVTDPHHFTWQLWDANGAMLMKGGDDYLPMSFYYVSKCVYVKQGTCVTLKFFDTDTDGNREIVSIVKDGVIIQNGLRLTKNEEEIKICN